MSNFGIMFFRELNLNMDDLRTGKIPTFQGEELVLTVTRGGESVMI